jgi:hypothetical protein
LLRCTSRSFHIAERRFPHAELIRFEACIRVSQSLPVDAWQGRSRQAVTPLEELGALPFVGMDCVEAAPACDRHELTSLAAAQRVRT